MQDYEKWRDHDWSGVAAFLKDPDRTVIRPVAVLASQTTLIWVQSAYAPMYPERSIAVDLSKFDSTWTEEKLRAWWHEVCDEETAKAKAQA